MMVIRGWNMREDVSNKTFVKRTQEAGGAEILREIEESQTSVLETFRADVTQAAADLYRRVPEEKADPILRNFFDKLVRSRFDVFYKHMEHTKCLPEDLVSLDNAELAVLYVFRRRVLDAAKRVYDAMPEKTADRALQRFFSKLVDDPPPL